MERHDGGIIGGAATGVVIGMIQVTHWQLFCEAVDMRKGIDSLLALILAEGCQRQPHAAYVFCNRSGTRLKVLLWDGLGFWLCARRLEQGRFHLPRDNVTPYELSGEQFRWLCAGMDWQRFSHQAPLPAWI